MLRIVKSRSGRQIYGPKWQNIDDRSDSIASTTTATATDGHVSEQDNENITWKGNSNAESMYKASLEGDWVAAEIVLARDPTLACGRITEEGDRPLHVAAAREHVVFVQKLVEKLSPSELAILDGHGYTACCYAAISGSLEIADHILKKNPSLGTARDQNDATPLHKAALHRNAKMVSYFLKSSKLEDLSRDEWFYLLLEIIRSKMYDVALELLEKDGSLATMRNEEGTVLHELARQGIAADVKHSYLKSMILDCVGIPEDLFKDRIVGKMQPDHRLLAEKLWGEIQKLDRNSIIELIKNPPILHDAAKVGNMELIIKILKEYPGAAKYFIATAQDEMGNNILHLAAKSAHPNARKIIRESVIEMQREIVWFKEVEALVPPPCLEMKNKDGYTPQELFSKEHRSMQEKDETWMRNTAHSCMLIGAIMLTLVFAAAFQVPGGNDQQTGIPVHLKSKWFTCFLVFEAVAMFCSAYSITVFWSIITSSFEEDKFLQILPDMLELGVQLLGLSLITSVSAFMSTYFLVFVGERVVLVKFAILLVYIMLLFVIYYKFQKIWLNIMAPRYLSKSHGPFQMIISMKGIKFKRLY